MWRTPRAERTAFCRQTGLELAAEIQLVCKATLAAETGTPAVRSTSRAARHCRAAFASPMMSPCIARSHARVVAAPRLGEGRTHQPPPRTRERVQITPPGTRSGAEHVSRADDRRAAEDDACTRTSGAFKATQSLPRPRPGPLSPTPKPGLRAAGCAGRMQVLRRRQQTRGVAGGLAIGKAPGRRHPGSRYRLEKSSVCSITVATAPRPRR